jgi:Ala-tRNA(Pro) deacylase
METVHARLCQLLMHKGIPYQQKEHAPVFTSEEAAQIRGVALSSGAKALLIKLDDAFTLFVLPADRRFDGKTVKKSLRAKSIRFATREELLELTGLEPGAVPPFGSLFGVATIIDPALAEQATLNFNAGDHAISFSMTFEDYLRAESPRREVCSLPA